MDKNKLLTALIFLLCLTFPLIAQDVDVSEEQSDEPEQVLKLEELIIELDPLKVFTIPRMEAELPPVDFVGIFSGGHMKPHYSVFFLDESDMKPAIVSDFSKMLAKERN